MARMLCAPGAHGRVSIAVGAKVGKASESSRALTTSRISEPAAAAPGFRVLAEHYLAEARCDRERGQFGGVRAGRVARPG